MFESLERDDAAHRLRNAAVVPAAAFLFAQFYVLLHPLLPRVPAALFWFIVAIVLAGAIAGAVLIVRIVRSERVRGRAAGWFALAVIAELVCLRQFLAFALPWL